MKRCPGCGLPAPPDLIAMTFSGTSNDHTRHAVIGICRRCIVANQRLPQAIQQKTILRAADRALDDPGTFLCAVYPTIDTARLAAAMTQHHQHGREALEALGWVTQDVDPVI